MGGLYMHGDGENECSQREGETKTWKQGDRNPGQGCDGPAWPGREPREALWGQSPAQLQDVRPGPPPGTPDTTSPHPHPR